MHNGEHLLGLRLGWLSTEKLSASLLVLVEVPDAAWLQPGITYRASPNLEFTVGAMLPIGGRPTSEAVASAFDDPAGQLQYITIPQSEFGLYPTFFFMQLKLLGS